MRGASSSYASSRRCEHFKVSPISGQKRPARAAKDKDRRQAVVSEADFRQNRQTLAPTSHSSAA
jgi:hypothetical protein